MAFFPGTIIKPEPAFFETFHQHFQRSTATESAASYVGIGWVEMTLECEYIPITQMLHM